MNMLSILINDLRRMHAFYVAHKGCGMEQREMNHMYMLWCPVHETGETVWYE